MRFANVTEIVEEESERRMAAAAAAIADARVAFDDWADGALAKGAARVAEMDGPEFAAAKDDIHTLFHDLKGAGGSVGLDLLSHIGGAGADFIRCLEAPSLGATRLAAAYIAAAQGILVAGIEGDGADAGTALLAKLAAAHAQLQAED